MIVKVRNSGFPDQWQVVVTRHRDAPMGIRYGQDGPHERASGLIKNSDSFRSHVAIDHITNFGSIPHYFYEIRKSS